MNELAYQAPYGFLTQGRHSILKVFFSISAGFTLAFVLFFYPRMSFILPILFLCCNIIANPRLGVYVLPFVLGNLMALTFFIDREIVLSILSPLQVICIVTAVSLVAQKFLNRMAFAYSNLYPFIAVILLILAIAVVAHHGPTATYESWIILRGMLAYFLVINLIQKREHIRRFIACLITPYALLASALVFLYIFFFRGSYYGLRSTDSSGIASAATTYGWLLNIIFPLVFSLFLVAKTRTTRFILFVISAFFISAIIFLFTRGGILTLSVSMAVLLFLSAKIKKRRIAILSIALAAVVIYIFLTHVIAGQFMLAQFSEVFDESVEPQRLNIYKWNIQTFLRNPLWGVGAGVGMRHSFLFSVLNNNGIFYFFVWFILFVTVYKNLRWLLRQKLDTFDRAVVIGLLSGFIGTIFISIFDPTIYGSVEYGMVFWMLRGIETAYVNGLKEREGLLLASARIY